MVAEDGAHLSEHRDALAALLAGSGRRDDPLAGLDPGVELVRSDCLAVDMPLHVTDAQTPDECELVM